MAETAEIDVAHVAKLARLNLTEEETKLFQEQLGRVLEYAEKLREPDTSQVEAAAHAVPIFNVFREDEPRAWFTRGRSVEQRAAAGQRPFHRPESRGMTCADLPALNIAELRRLFSAAAKFLRAKSWRRFRRGSRK